MFINIIKSFFLLLLFFQCYIIKAEDLMIDDDDFLREHEPEILKDFVKTRWSFIYLTNFGLTYSDFCSNLNSKMEKKFPKSKLGDIKKLNYKVNLGFFIGQEFITGYKTLDWLENQISIGLCLFVFENPELRRLHKKKNDLLYPNEKLENFLNKKISLDLGTNFVFYQNDFFEFLGFGIRFSFSANENSKFIFLPIIRLGCGYQFDFGLLLKCNLNLSHHMFTLGTKYEDVLDKVYHKKEVSQQEIAVISSVLSLNFLEFSIGYNYGKLIDIANKTELRRRFLLKRHSKLKSSLKS